MANKMTYEEVKKIRQNPTMQDVDNAELQRLIDEAVEKQIANKVKNWNGQACCPNCDKLYGNIKNIPSYSMFPRCHWCGQRLDWCEAEE